jgi:hypothetical protein
MGEEAKMPAHIETKNRHIQNSEVSSCTQHCPVTSKYNGKIWQLRL